MIRMTLAPVLAPAIVATFFRRLAVTASVAVPVDVVAVVTVATSTVLDGPDDIDVTSAFVVAVSSDTVSVAPKVVEIGDVREATVVVRLGVGTGVGLGVGLVVGFDVNTPAVGVVVAVSVVGTGPGVDVGVGIGEGLGVIGAGRVAVVDGDDDAVLAVAVVAVVVTTTKVAVASAHETDNEALGPSFAKSLISILNPNDVELTTFAGMLTSESDQVCRVNEPTAQSRVEDAFKSAIC
jgi:hypothetical protein